MLLCPGEVAGQPLHPPQPEVRLPPHRCSPALPALPPAPGLALLLFLGSLVRASVLTLLNTAPAPWFPEHRLHKEISFLGHILGTRAPPATLPINCAEKIFQKFTYALELYSCLFP